MFEKYILTVKISFFSAVVLSMLAVSSHAASAGDILYYYNLALKNDPQFRGVEFDTLAARESIRQAYAELLPKIFGELKFSRTYQDVHSSDNDVYETGTTEL